MLMLFLGEINNNNNNNNNKQDRTEFVIILKI